MAADACVSLGSVNKAVRSLKAGGLLACDGTPTPAGIAALEPYRVRNAVILAAGAGTRLSPLSFERPKAAFEVRGEVLVERQIRQLRAAGVQDVAVVVGHMKEAFFYLEEDFGVTLIENPDHAARNNNGSVWAARSWLGNSYVVSSDEYFCENPFRPYRYESTFSVCRAAGPTSEQVVELDSQGHIAQVSVGGDAGDLYLLGPAYLSRDFAERYLAVLGAEYDRAATASKLWEQVFAEHAAELPMAIEELPAGTVFEFDYLGDLMAFDRDFFANVDSAILENICATLGCSRNEICGLAPVSAGLTNLSTVFSVGGARYIYRHPGAGTEQIVNRAAEAHALAQARDLGLDDTYVFEDPEQGWKISRFVEGCRDFDYANPADVSRALALVRRLHESGATSPWSFDFFEEGTKIAGLLRRRDYPLPRDFDALSARVAELAAAMARTAGEPVLCHNDFYGPNLLVRDDAMRLIDWEYAAMGDPFCDLGNFVAQGSGYSVEEALAVLPVYLGRAATPNEELRFLSAVAVVGWYWYVWAMYKEAMGSPVGQWLYVWYKAAKTFSAAAERSVGAQASARKGATL
ncbi:phosphotransferase [Atopobiaceae bacterium 24-176]